MLSLEQVFLDKDYQKKIINKCFNGFMDMDKADEILWQLKPVVLVRPYLGSISLQTRTNFT